MDIVTRIVLPAIDHALNHSCNELVKLQLLPPGTGIARTTERQLTKEYRPDVIWKLVYQKDFARYEANSGNNGL